METIEALIHRRSCRKYSDRPVEAEKLARIIEAGQYAPSGMGRQPVTFVAVTDPATVERLSQLNAQVMDSNSDPFYGACPPTAACAVSVTAFLATPRTRYPRQSRAATTWCT